MAAVAHTRETGDCRSPEPSVDAVSPKGDGLKEVLDDIKPINTT